MKTLVKNPVTKIVAQAGVYATTFLPLSALASNPTSGPACSDPKTASIEDAAQCAQATNSQPSTLFGNGGIFQTISNVLIFLVGAVSVIMLIWGGFQYVISSGDSKRVESAKNTILYAIVGIVVAILAYAIVGFVTGSLTPTTTPTS